MSEEAIQRRLIEQAHASRANDNVPDGTATLTFFMEPFTSLGLRLLAEARPDLKGLYLIRTEVEDDGFEAINAFRDLETLDLSETRLSPTAILQLDPTLPLRQLRLGGRQVSPQSFAHLAQFSALRELDISEVLRWNQSAGKPIDEALLHLRRMPWLEALNLGGHIIRGPGLQAIRELTGLRLLGLNDTEAPSEALASLAGLNQLETLFLGRTGLNDEA